MNQFMKTQIQNMIFTLSVFKTSCQMAAKKDDGTINKEEAKQLARINKAADKFEAELMKIK